jgi:predicted nuclease with RNAse H fold
LTRSVAGVELTVDVAVDADHDYAAAAKWRDCDVLLSREAIQQLEGRGRRLTSLYP